MSTFNYHILLDNILFLFVFIFLLFYVLRQYQNIFYITKNVNKDDICKDLKHYKIKNIYLEWLILGIYLFLAIIIFIILRIYSLNASMDTVFLNKITINYLTIYKIVLYFLTVTYYLKLLELIFHKHIMKMHFYLHQYERYHDGVSEYIREHFNWVNGKFIDISHFFYMLKKSPEAYIKDAEYMDDFVKTHQSWRNDFTYKLILLLNKYPKGYILCNYIDNVIYKIPINSPLFRYLPYVFCVVVCIYDMLHYNFHWIFYALFLLLIIKNIQKIRRFYYTKDILYDGVISNYIYEKENDMIIFEASIEEYIKNNYTREIVVEIEKGIEHKRSLSKAKKRSIILLLFFGILYFYVQGNKYILNMTMPMYIICIIPFVIIYVIHILQEKYWLRNKKYPFGYKWIFVTPTVILGAIMLYTMLKNKITLFPNEIILMFSDKIIVQEMFSLEDKLLHMKRYLNYAETLNLITSAKNNYIFMRLHDMLKDNTNISMQELRNLAKYLIHKNDDDVTETMTFLGKIKQLVYNLWKALWN